MLGIIIALLIGEAFVRIFLDLPNKDYRKLFVSDQSVGFNSTENAVTLIHEGGEINFGRQPKTAIGEQLMQQVIELFGEKLIGEKKSP